MTGKSFGEDVIDQSTDLQPNVKKKDDKINLFSSKRPESSSEKQHREESPTGGTGVYQFPDLKKRKSKLSGTMSVLEDPVQQMLDSSLD